MKKLNCMSYALNIESSEKIGPGNLDWTLSPKDAIASKCAEFGLSSRPLENSKALLEADEWMICFFGFYPGERDYEYRIIGYDYHFLKKVGNQWHERRTWGSMVSKSPINELIAEFKIANIEPQYFAIRKIED